MSTHRFTPHHYFNTLGSHPPVLRIRDGDTVVTTTLDARGFDATGTSAAPRGNPQTGPFYVEGADSGDTLAVHLDRLAPNRPTGWSGTVIAPNVLEPAFVRDLPLTAVTQWWIDLERRTITLADSAAGRPSLPLSEIDRHRRAATRAEIPSLAHLAIAFAPMVGCFGVAPAGGQAISTATSGPHGGNMDYRGFTEGATALFPVFAPGALFHLGDCHAAQGDGEIVGNGVEVSFEVQFTVRVHKGRRIEWPRGENDAYIFALGNARPLDQALQHATTEMVRWLAEDHGLDARAASTLLGQCVEYEIGNVYNPAYTVVCKVPKRILRDLRQGR
ncbi:MAG TPA: acetamidase/formamidase family protein [bacterium]|nr:acetamidase/formamidase family protein [bacterium]